MRDPETGVDVVVYTCAVCEDTGFVECPTLSLSPSEEYLGHGPCDCHACRRWPEQMKRWAEDRGRTIPSAVVEAAKAGRVCRHMALHWCPFCAQGERCRDWLSSRRTLTRKERDRTSAAPAMEVVRIDPHSSQGQALLEMRRASGGTGNRLTVEHVNRFTQRMAQGHAMKVEYHPDSDEEIRRTDERRKAQKARAHALFAESRAAEEAGR